MEKSSGQNWEWEINWESQSLESLMSISKKDLVLIGNRFVGNGQNWRENYEKMPPKQRNYAQMWPNFSPNIL
jgi:hypothetical protein